MINDGANDLRTALVKIFFEKDEAKKVSINIMIACVVKSFNPNYQNTNFPFLPLNRCCSSSGK